MAFMRPHGWHAHILFRNAGLLRYGNSATVNYHLAACNVISVLCPCDNLGSLPDNCILVSNTSDGSQGWPMACMHVQILLGSMLPHWLFLPPSFFALDSCCASKHSGRFRYLSRLHACACSSAQAFMHARKWHDSGTRK